MSGNFRSTWTPERDAQLQQLWRARPHLTLVHIAAVMNTSKSTVAKRLRELNYPTQPAPGRTNTKPRPERTEPLPMRRCLAENCRELFQPTYEGQWFHPHHKPTESGANLKVRIPSRKSF